MTRCLREESSQHSWGGNQTISALHHQVGIVARRLVALAVELTYTFLMHSCFISDQRTGGSGICTECMAPTTEHVAVVVIIALVYDL